MLITAFRFQVPAFLLSAFPISAFQYTCPTEAHEDLFTGKARRVDAEKESSLRLTMPTEADTCRKLVVPKLQAAGWDNDPHSIAEQRWFTPVPAAELLAAGCNLDRKSPRAKEDITHLPPAQLAESILQNERRIGEIMQSIQKLLGKHGT